MALIFQRPAIEPDERRVPEAPKRRDHTANRPRVAFTEPVGFDELGMVEVLSERSVIDVAAQIADSLCDAVEPGTEVTLATGTVYVFDPLFGMLFRDGAPLNTGRFGRGPAGPFDDITIVRGDRVDALAFFAELPTLIERLKTQ